MADSTFSSLISNHDDLNAKGPLFVPDLEDCSELLEKYLKMFFEEATVKVVHCPDLRRPPYSLQGKSIGHCLKVVSVGGEANLIPKIKEDRIFALKRIAKKCGCEHNEVFIFGSAMPTKNAANTTHNGGIAIIDAIVNDANETSITKVIQVVDEVPELNTYTSPEFALLADLAISQQKLDGIPPKVLKIKAKIRKGVSSFPEAIRHFLGDHYPNQSITLAGVFIVKNGKVKVEVVPEISEGTEFESKEKYDEWLKTCEIYTPLTCVSILHVHEPPHLFLRKSDTTCYNIQQKTGGNFVQDLDPEEVEYEGYFAPGEYLYQIDQHRTLS